MRTAFQYYHKFESARGSVSGLPPWARSIVMLAALPGIALIALSILALGVSILALLLLAVPAYLLMRTLTLPAGQDPQDIRDDSIDRIDSPDLIDVDAFALAKGMGRKRIESTVIEPDGSGAK